MGYEEKQAVAALRTEHYNSVVTSFRMIHDDLLIMRVRPQEPLGWQAGHFTTLGLGSWEPRAAGCQPESREADESPRLIRRAYSISSRILDDEGRLVRAGSEPELEFYVALVRRAAKAPALTPRLFMLKTGASLYVGQRTHGRYLLRPANEQDTILFLATGTGEAPHNTMIAELLANGHAGPIVSVVCTRYAADLAYQAVHRQLEARYRQYHYVPLTTREPVNLDPAVAGYVGKRYIQDYVGSGDLERELAVPLDPATTHVYLCGNPAMIGAVEETPGADAESTPSGMLQLLQSRGFVPDEPRQPGNVYFEKFWH